MVGPDIVEVDSDEDDVQPVVIVDAVNNDGPELELEVAEVEIGGDGEPLVVAVDVIDAELREVEVRSNEVLVARSELVNIAAKADVDGSELKVNDANVAID